MAIVEVGRRGQLDTEHAVAAAKGLLTTRETYPSATIVIGVAGYEADERELWDIDEVVDYLLEVFDTVFTEWADGSLNDLNLDDSSAALVLWRWCSVVQGRCGSSGGIRRSAISCSRRG